MKQTIYNNISEWYNPEIDYWEMLNNFRYTKDPLKEAIGYKPTMTVDGVEYPNPLDHVTLMFHAKAWEYDKVTKKEYPSKQQQFQFWNKQFNDALTKVLQKMKPKLILEVGAGQGILSKILTDRGFNVKAIDNFSWPFDKRYFKIEKIDYKNALLKYQPDVVIGSWMPLGTDWTKDFRKTKSVKHYIIIGEVDACCGGDWTDRKTWPMKRENEISKYALCRTDDLWWKDNGNLDEHFMMHHSSVYSFSRRKYAID